MRKYTVQWTSPDFNAAMETRDVWADNEWQAAYLVGEAIRCDPEEFVSSLNIIRVVEVINGEG